MPMLEFGDRVARNGTLRVACSAAVFDSTRTKILLTRRSDNNQWCLPGGGVDAGETLRGACLREVFEETGLRIRTHRLIGVYSDPNCLVVYPDGNAFHIVALSFEATIEDESEASATDEVLESKYFCPEDIESIELFQFHKQRVLDAFASHGWPFLRDS